MPKLNPQLTVNQVVRQWPQTMKIFAQHSIDLCCGGGKTLEVAAAAHGIELAELLARLEEIVGGEGSGV